MNVIGPFNIWEIILLAILVIQFILACYNFRDTKRFIRDAKINRRDRDIHYNAYIKERPAIKKCKEYQ